MQYWAATPWSRTRLRKVVIRKCIVQGCEIFSKGLNCSLPMSVLIPPHRSSNRPPQGPLQLAPPFQCGVIPRQIKDKAISSRYSPATCIQNDHAFLWNCNVNFYSSVHNFSRNVRLCSVQKSIARYSVVIGARLPLYTQTRIACNIQQIIKYFVHSSILKDPALSHHAPSHHDLCLRGIGWVYHYHHRCNLLWLGTRLSWSLPSGS